MAAMGDEAANQVVLASDASIERFALRGDGAWMANVAEFAAAGRVLTDDYAPVDQLITTRR